MKKRAHGNQGFTVIELVLVILLVLILAVIVAASYNSVRTRERNTERRNEVTIIQGKLEVYYAKFSQYPTLEEINNDKWREENLKDFNTDQLTDPLATISALAGKPSDNQYSYEVSGTDGKECNNKETPCTQYTLTTRYEGGGTFSKTNIN